MKLAYFVHNLNDPAVDRRLRMLHAGGATVVLLGFCRGEPPQSVEGIVPLLLGRTKDAHLWWRAVSVVRGLLALPRLRGSLSGIDMILSRQLETLVLAGMARQLWTPGTKLVFECLDIHPLMLRRGPLGWALRKIEGRMLANCQALMVSSPHFIESYFGVVHVPSCPVILVENKVLAVERDDQSASSRHPASIQRACGHEPGPPWRIGWYGMIRCWRSLRLLADLAVARQEMVEIIVGGRVATAMLPAFEAVIAETPGLVFIGPYDRRRDLARIYSDVHFAWAVDFSEDGGNSDWLLPNRLYEAALFGAIPIARAEVATGGWLARRGIGAVLQGEPAQALGAFFEQLDATRYDAMKGAMASLPDTDFVHTNADCEALLDRLACGPPAAPRASALRIAVTGGNR